MDFRTELAKWGYNKGNSIDVEILVNEILPQLLNKKQNFFELKEFLLSKLWDFCEKEFGADFENDYIRGYGCRNGMSDRTDVFTEHLANELIKFNKE
jgi:hypothetical protein